MATAVQDPITERRSVQLTVSLAVLGVFVTYVPITSVSVSLTSIGATTGAATPDLQWVSDSYIIPMAAMVLSAGVFGDLHGRRRVFLVGMALTIAGALIAGLGATLGGITAVHVLWAGQAISGVGGGLLLPTTLALIAHAVPDPRERARFVALWATGLVLGLAVGPLIAGLILEVGHWGWIFAPTVVLAVATGGLALLRLPESKAPEGRRLDWPGQITATVAIAASIYGVIEGGRTGWSSPQAIAGLAAGVIALVGFVVVELRSDAPLMQLELFRVPAFTAAGVSALVALFAIVGAMFLLSLFFGGVQRLSPLEIGWRLLFITGVSAVASPAVGRLMSRLQPMTVLAGGLLLAAVSMLLMLGIDDGTGFADAAWRLSVFGVAEAVMLTSVAVASIDAVPHRLAGMAAAVNTVLRQYGAALGPAVLGVILTARIDAGAPAASALHTALLANAGLLVLAAAGCALAELRSARLD